jgi:hypothetical protein
MLCEQLKLHLLPTCQGMCCAGDPVGPSNMRARRPSAVTMKATDKQACGPSSIAFALSAWRCPAVLHQLVWPFPVTIMILFVHLSINFVNRAGAHDYCFSISQKTWVLDTRYQIVCSAITLRPSRRHPGTAPGQRQRPKYKSCMAWSRFSLGFSLMPCM